jgi:hypothetical protein
VISKRYQKRNTNTREIFVSTFPLISFLFTSIFKWKAITDVACKIHKISNIWHLWQTLEIDSSHLASSAKYYSTNKIKKHNDYSLMISRRRSIVQSILKNLISRNDLQLISTYNGYTRHEYESWQILLRAVDRGSRALRFEFHFVP